MMTGTENPKQSTSKRIILHVDMDSFYPAVEQQQNPDLIGKPVIVGADPKGGKGRGVVTSCSYEARKFGVRSAQPISIAYRLCPDAVFLPPNFALYAEASTRIMNLLKEFADRLEQVGIDEAFLDVTSRVSGFEEAADYAKKIKEAIRQHEGLICSIGIAHNKSIAKIASDFQKPDGLTVVEPSRAKMFLDPLPVSKISGIGRKTSEVLERMGIKTIGQLSSKSGKELAKHFGKGGVWMWAIANGLEEVEVQDSREIKSIGAEHTFEKDTSDRSFIMKTFQVLIDEVHSRLLEEKLLYRNVAIKVRFEGFLTFSRERTLKTYNDEKPEIEQNVKALFKEFENEKRKFRLIGVRLHAFVPAEKQYSLLTWAK